MFFLYFIPYSFVFECKNLCPISWLYLPAAHMYDTLPQRVCVARLEKLGVSQGSFSPTLFACSQHLLLVPSLGTPPVVAPGFILCHLSGLAVLAASSTQTPTFASEDFFLLQSSEPHFPAPVRGGGISDTTSQNSLP